MATRPFGTATDMFSVSASRTAAWSFGRKRTGIRYPHPPRAGAPEPWPRSKKRTGCRRDGRKCPRPRNRPSGHRACKADRSHARAIDGDRSSFRERTPIARDGTLREDHLALNAASALRRGPALPYRPPSKRMRSEPSAFARKSMTARMRAVRFRSLCVRSQSAD